jgi:hypothetical protein
VAVIAAVVEEKERCLVSQEVSSLPEELLLRILKEEDAVGWQAASSSVQSSYPPTLLSLQNLSHLPGCKVIRVQWEVKRYETMMNLLERLL